MLILIYQFPLRTMTSCYCFGAHSALMFTALAEVWKVRPLFAKKILVNSDKCWGLGFLTKRLFCFYVFEAFLDKNYLSKSSFQQCTYPYVSTNTGACIYMCVQQYHVLSCKYNLAIFTDVYQHSYIGLYSKVYLQSCSTQIKNAHM